MKIYEKPTQKLIEDFAKQTLTFDQRFCSEDVIRWFAKHYPKTKNSTIKKNIEGLSVNNPEHRCHHPHIKPDLGWDLFYKLGPNEFRLWNPEKDPAPLYGTESDTKISRDAGLVSDFMGLKTRPLWVVTSKFEGADYTSDFIHNGFWENKGKSRERYSDDVKTVQAGDHIILKKSSYRTDNLPFQTNGYYVPVMAIDASGIIEENPNDGYALKVQWNQHFQQPREWYFFDWNRHFWRVNLNGLYGKKLFGFAIDREPQDIDEFRNNSYWKERFGDISNRFAWTRFYAELANKLRDFKDQRQELLRILNEIRFQVLKLPPLTDKLKDGSESPMKDFCPFSTIAQLNRQIKHQNRVHIATEFKRYLNMSQPIPKSFEGIPVLSNQNSNFFAFEKDRKPEDIDRLWDFFEKAIEYSESESDSLRSSFVASFDGVSKVRGVKWNLSMGLYWIRPWEYLTLDEQSRNYLSKFGISAGNVIVGGRINAERYLDLMTKLKTRFEENEFPVHSFPELSTVAYGNPPITLSHDLDENGKESVAKPYSIDSIVDDGCFIRKSRLEEIHERLAVKQNLILQGPPGTGKTWLAKRLGFALIGTKDQSKIRAIQFHPGLSYEDFIRGWRPGSDGRLELSDGPFMEIVNVAKQDPNSNYVLVIEEINRGNPAQIFGEMLTLMETSKRIPAEGLELTYGRSKDERVYVPKNLFIIGTMNLADRSLTLVDIALRRRFAFIDLKPELNKHWTRWVCENHGIDKKILEGIKTRIEKLNQTISDDDSLGPQFKVGHSFVTPDQKPKDPMKWFEDVVETEIGPLLEEYWFDNKDQYQNARKNLLDKW